MQLTQSSVAVASNVDRACQVLRSAGLVAYPSEGIWGLGCDPSARQAVDRIVTGTVDGQKLALNLCISYGSRAELARAARLLAEDVAQGKLEPSAIDESTFASRLLTATWPDPDLLIRTSGEMRLSNFLLWQLAYAELYVSPVLWPDFAREHFFEAILNYQQRDRRFGRVIV